MKNYKKHTIWSNMNLDIKDWQDMFEEEGITDKSEQYERMCNVNSDYLEDERINLSPIKGKILAIADLGLWNGRKTGYKIYNSIKDIFYSECDYCEWYVNPTGLHFTGHHHDGTNYYEYRLVRDNTDIDNLENWLNDIVFNNKELSQRTLQRYTVNLWKPIKNIYGY